LIWLSILVLAALAMAPLARVLWRGGAARGRREAAMALHRAQLAELGRDLAEGRLGEAEHASAELEVQRRLLAAAEDRDAPAAGTSRAPLVFALIAVPVTAFALYLAGGLPWLPSVYDDPRLPQARQEAREEARMVALLRQKLPTLDPHSETARQGYILLGSAEARRGDMQGAANAWRAALGIRFDPSLAAEAAEAVTEANGGVTAEAAALFRQALDAAPPDAPWRPMAEKRLSQAPP
jgi:cytochrome c-type biogenesis protein CcmH